MAMRAARQRCPGGEGGGVVAATPAWRAPRRWCTAEVAASPNATMSATHCVTTPQRSASPPDRCCAVGDDANPHALVSLRPEWLELLGRRSTPRLGRVAAVLPLWRLGGPLVLNRRRASPCGARRHRGSRRALAPSLRLLRSCSIRLLPTWLQNADLLVALAKALWTGARRHPCQQRRRSRSTPSIRSSYGAMASRHAAGAARPRPLRRRCALNHDATTAATAQSARSPPRTYHTSVCSRACRRSGLTDAAAPAAAPVRRRGWVASPPPPRRSRTWTALTLSNGSPPLFQRRRHRRTHRRRRAAAATVGATAPLRRATPRRNLLASAATSMKAAASAACCPPRRRRPTPSATHRRPPPPRTTATAGEIAFEVAGRPTPPSSSIASSSALVVRAAVVGRRRPARRRSPVAAARAARVCSEPKNKSRHLSTAAALLIGGVVVPARSLSQNFARPSRKSLRPCCRAGLGTASAPDPRNAFPVPRPPLSRPLVLLAIDADLRAPHLLGTDAPCSPSTMSRSMMPPDLPAYAVVIYNRGEHTRGRFTVARRFTDFEKLHRALPFMRPPGGVSTSKPCPTSAAW